MNLLEQFIGYPMAAPESEAMRRLRFTFIILTLLSSLLILSIGMMVPLFGRVVVGAVLALSLFLTGGGGALFFFKKWRIDDQWLLERASEPEGKRP